MAGLNFGGQVSDTTDVCNKVSPTPDQQSASNTTTTTYCYDAIGRITQKAYTSQSCPMSSPTVSYAYDQGGAAADAIGRLTYMSDPSGSETYTYDTTHRMGWIAQVQKLVGSTTYTTSYGYDASGDMTQITYPSGRVVQQGYNQIGQLCAVATSANSGCGTVTGPYASGYGYNPAGQVLDFTYGNGVYASMGYSTNRSQLNCLDYSTTNRGANCTHDATTLFGLTYYYQNDPTNCTTGASYNNGQIQCIADAVDAGRSVAYTYDAWGRLNTALTAGDASYPQWGLSETYDRYGNRRCQNVTAGSGPYVACMNYTNNQPPGYTFDAAGNMITEPLNPVNNYGYDARNRMTSSAGNGGTATYTYDDNDDRVQKSISGGTSTVYIYSGDEDIAEYDNGAAPGSPSREYVYGNSQLLTQIDSSGTHYFHQDQLSPRLITDSTGAVTGQQGHFPFGEPWYSSNGSGEWVFTTYQRNSENGLDYALARFYDSRVASFCSADPIEGRPGDPQSWNRYAYGGNDPIDITDPNGQSWWAWLIDAIIGAAAVILPEVDPGLLPFLTGSSTISGTVTTGSLGIDAGTGYLESVTNVATFSSTVDWGILAADSGAAVAAQGAQSPPHPTPEQKFTNCVSTYGNENAKNNLTYQGYQDAQQAARAAKIPASDELALWNNENSLNLNFPPVPPTGEVGPIQIRPGVVSDLKAANSLPPGWDSDPVANLTAGALYFGKMLQRVGESRAAAAYNAGVRGERLGRGNPYQKAYNQAKSMANNIINCMH